MRNKLKVLAAVLMSALLCSCDAQRLIVDTEYVSARSLASTHVNTPDPKRCCPTTGQRLIVMWHFPSEYLDIDDSHIELTVRFGNNEEDLIDIPLEVAQGMFTYAALDDDYWQRDGIRTYRARFIAEGCIVEEWQHQLWAELICLEIDEEEEGDEPFECDCCPPVVPEPWEILDVPN